MLLIIYLFIISVYYVNLQLISRSELLPIYKNIMS